MNSMETFTPTGIRIVGTYENCRNMKHSALFKDIIKEAFGVQDVIIAHHLVYVRVERRDDGFEYQVIEEIPSADALILDHEIAKKIWGRDWQHCIKTLALEPVETRDSLLDELYYSRRKRNDVYPA